MFNRELPKLWSDAIIVGEATILAVPINLLHLLTIQEPGYFGRRGREEGEPGPSTPGTPMSQIIMIPPQPYQFPPLAPQQYLPPPAPAGRQSSPPGPADPADLHSYSSGKKVSGHGNRSLQTRLGLIRGCFEGARPSLFMTMTFPINQASYLLL